MIWIYYDLLNGIKLDLQLDTKTTLALLKTTLTFGFSHTKHSLT